MEDFWVRWEPSSRVVIHRVTCQYCKHRETPAAWVGFETYEDVQTFAIHVIRRKYYDCAICHPEE